MRNCDWCGTQFEPVNRHNRFCKVSCKTAWGNTNKPLLRHICIGCGHSFMTKQAKQRYCSRSCSTKHSTIEKACICVGCGKPFRFVGRTRRHRCNECMPAWQSKRQMAWRAQKNPTIKIGVGSGGNQWGKNNHMWKPADEHRSTRYRANWRQRCFKVWPRICQACGSTKALEVHHINGNPEDYATYNLIPLCFDCHIHKIHNKRYKTAVEYIKVTMAILPLECRNKIAELSGNPEMGIRTEDYANNQGQSIGTEITSPRGRDTLLTE